MHLQSPPLTIGGTVLKEFDNLVILGVTFNSKMTFEKHLCSVSRAASQRLGILRKCCRALLHSCTAPLQNLAVQPDFYSPLGVPLEQSCLPRIRWCGTGGFQEQGQCFFIRLSCSIPTIVFYSFSLSLLSVYWLVLWGWGLRTDRVYITLSQPCTADIFLIIIIVITSLYKLVYLN